MCPSDPIYGEFLRETARQHGADQSSEAFDKTLKVILPVMAPATRSAPDQRRPRKRD